MTSQGSIEKMYHIYAKDRCIFHSLNEEEFEGTWKALNHLMDIMDTRYAGDDLTYEEHIVNKNAILESSH
jgi:hypothetical protein